MDAYSGKRPGDGFAVSKKGSAHVVSDSANNRDQNAQFCTRIGCSGRLNTAKGVHRSSPQKGRSSRSSFHPSSIGKEIIGSSSRTCSAFNKSTKSLPETQRILSSPVETDSSETASVEDESGVPDLLTLPRRIGGGFHPEFDDTGYHLVAPMEVGSSRVASSARSPRTSRERSGLVNQDNLGSSPFALASKSKIQGTHANASRYGPKNLHCNSTSDVVHSGSSSSDSNLSRKKDIVKKRICDGESSSSAKGKKMNWSSVEVQNPSSSSGISISDTRRTLNRTPNGDGSAPSVRTQRFSGYTRARAANQGHGNNLLANRPHNMVSQMSQPDMPIALNASSSSLPFSMENSLSRPTSYGRPGNSNDSDSLRGRPSSPAEVGNNRSLLNRESFQRYNMDGIAEVLLALERIEQDEELTYEQFLVLETNLFLDGLSFYDQHRDMRLDIDNMSYEELLALEERMGTVSTALTEDALSECLKISLYCSADATTSNGKEQDKDDVKCSICQEDYADGDEVGRLQCQHMYHVVCAHQWLRLKNWCPICKASAARS